MIQGNANRRNSQEYLRDQIVKWREERQTRMIARVLHNRQGKISSAVFGAISTSNSNRSKIFQKNQQICTAGKPISKSIKSSGLKTKPQKMPEIKHTLASKLRMIKANPLLEARGIITVPEKYKKSLDLINKNDISIYEQQTKLPNNFVKNSQVQKSSARMTNDQKKVTSNKFTPKGRSSRKDKPCTSVNRSNVGKRSLSADVFRRKFTDTGANELETKMKRFHSVADMEGLDVSRVEDNEELENDVFPFPDTPVSIQTPQRSRYIPFSNSVGRQSMISPSNVYTPTPDVMRKQLSDWLKKRGKSFGNFHHLQCFGLHASNTSNFKKSSFYQKTNMPNRSNFNISTEYNCVLTSAEPCSSITAESQRAERIIINDSISENKENVCTQSPDKLAQDALEDLINIIKFGYPLEQCNQWLTVISRSFPGVKEVPVYWECFALLEEARGDLKSAVDCYERAIIRGAHPEKVSDSLDQLMEKFNLLNLKSDLQADGSSKTPRKQVNDARNIFKSTIIRFALQQKAVKSLSSNLGISAASLNYVATPVRRSTRPSSSRYSVTPGVLCLKSLNQLEPDIRKGVVFEPNPALN